MIPEKLDPAKLKRLIQTFGKFSFVGGIGFVVDTGILYALTHLAGIDPYLSRLCSYLTAATVTWLLNRKITFAYRNSGDVRGEWSRYVLWNAAGAVSNYGIYALLIYNSAFFATYLVLAVACGAVVALFLNFFSSYVFVFTERNSSLP